MDFISQYSHECGFLSSPFSRLTLVVVSRSFCAAPEPPCPARDLAGPYCFPASPPAWGSRQRSSVRLAPRWWALNGPQLGSGRSTGHRLHPQTSCVHLSVKPARLDRQAVKPSGIVVACGGETQARLERNLRPDFAPLIRGAGSRRLRRGELLAVLGQAARRQLESRCLDALRGDVCISCGGAGLRVSRAEVRLVLRTHDLGLRGLEGHADTQQREREERGSSTACGHP